MTAPHGTEDQFGMAAVGREVARTIWACALTACALAGMTYAWAPV